MRKAAGIGVAALVWGLPAVAHAHPSCLGFVIAMSWVQQVAAVQEFAWKSAVACVGAGELTKRVLKQCEENPTRAFEYALQLGTLSVMGDDPKVRKCMEDAYR